MPALLGPWVRVAVMVMVLAATSCLRQAGALGSMNSMAASYGENGQTLCTLRADKANVVTCFGSDVASVYGAPPRLPLLGLTGGDGFVCGLSMGVKQPYCWGNNIYVEAGVPAVGDRRYATLSAGDNHLCALRQSVSYVAGGPAVDCWGYNMTGSFINAPLLSITSGSFFSCGLYAANFTPVCWGDETGSGAISTAPTQSAFISISAGGYHVCGILQTSRNTFCWGRSLDAQAGVPKGVIFSFLVGGKFSTCGLRADHHFPLCWGLSLPNNTPIPSNVTFSTLVAGDYFICGLAGSQQPQCWGSGYPVTLPLGVTPGMCSSQPCLPGTYSLSPEAVKALSASGASLCPNPNDSVCVGCSVGCPDGLLQSVPCTPTADRQCSYNCSQCNNSSACSTACSPRMDQSTESIQIPIIIGELVTAVVVIGVLLMVAFFCVRRKLTKVENAKGSNKAQGVVSKKSSFRSLQKVKVQDSVDKKVRARAFSYKELEDATGGFSEENEIGRGSFSNVYKGVLSDGQMVAVKTSFSLYNDGDTKVIDLIGMCHAMQQRPASPASGQQSYNSKEFNNEIDLLSRLNHAHLLNLIGYCNEGGERLLVYEYMEMGTLYEHLHGSENPQLSWVTRVKIAVQAARGLEYLHGYACPSVIHRDIKSSNILLDDEWNARVADFGLSLFGPSDSSKALSELPAGTLGYLDPEYYRLHYLTTKSDVYSFGVLLFEILAGRKAIDMEYEDGNLVEWAVPLIKKGEILSMLDPRLDHPVDPEGLLRIARVAARCVRLRGKDRPSMDRVTTSLERSLALLMGTPSDGELILPSEVVLGSSRLHTKGSRSKSSHKSSHSRLSSALTADSSWQALEAEHQSIASSRRQRRWPSDLDDKAPEDTRLTVILSPPETKTSGLTEKGSEIAPASPQQVII